MFAFNINLFDWKYKHSADFWIIIGFLCITNVLIQTPQPKCGSSDLLRLGCGARSPHIILNQNLVDRFPSLEQKLR